MLRVILATLGICIALLLWQTHRLSRTQSALKTLQDSNIAAAAASELRAASTGQEAVSSYVQTQERDAPVVERVVTRTVNVCLREQADRLPVPAVARGTGPASGKAQDDADREWIQAVAADLKTCAAELNRLDAIRDFHNANGG